jgi:inhibitor of KinA sporulation pathway (predicted exonuclease)
MRPRPPRPPPKRWLLVVDLEATCDEPRQIPKREIEVIELGAVLVRGDDLSVEARFSAVVRPTLRPTLTPFCTQLTGISQVEVDAAPPLPDALAALAAALPLADPGLRFCSWGDFDEVQLRRECARLGLPHPFPGGHTDLRELFRRAHGGPRRYGVRTALERVGLPFHGAAHRALPDAENAARLLPWCLQRAPFPPLPPAGAPAAAAPAAPEPPDGAPP